MDANKIVKQMSTSDWLKGSDIDGQEIPVTIKMVEQQMQKREGQDIPQLVLHFSEEDVKKLGLNIGNTNIMIGMCGGDTDKWAGKSITLYTVMTQNRNGEQVPGIRIKAPNDGTPTKSEEDTMPGNTSDEPPMEEAPPY